MYSVKEMFYTLQGEGLHTGRPAVFCRFTGCNLWSGIEKHRGSAICNFCDTDFLGTDGVNGGKFSTPEALAEAVDSQWPLNQSHKFLVCTGGEPLLQLDDRLIIAFRDKGFEIAIETNGTQPLPNELIDWVCVSPKGRSDVVITQCDELKLVYPQEDALPKRFAEINAKYRYLTPKADPHLSDQDELYRDSTTQQTIRYCLEHPEWRLNLQSHKVINIA